MPDSKRKLVLVCGDVIRDHHTYMGERETHDSRALLGSMYRPRLGGARLLHQMIEMAASTPLEAPGVRAKRHEMRRFAKDQLAGFEKTGRPSEGRDAEAYQLIERKLSEDPARVVRYDVAFDGELEDANVLPTHLQGFAIWKPYLVGSDPDSSDRVWRVEKPLGYGSRVEDDPQFPHLRRTPPDPAPDILVIDDAGLGVRSAQPTDWPSALRQKTASVSWIVIKMARPLAHGRLWDVLVRDYPKKLIVIVSIDDIRRDSVRVSKGISWERSALDLVDELHKNSAVDSLLKGRHLVVNFRSEGALHVEHEGSDYSHRLVFDPRHLEDEWQGTRQGSVFGYTSCLTAGIVHRLVTDGADRLEAGIAAGLNAMRVLFERGHGAVGGENPSYDYEAVARTIDNDQRAPFAAVMLPTHDAEMRESGWTVLAATERELGRADKPLFGIATGIALAGETALDRVPHLHLGDLKTVDRNEIEALRTIQQLIINYRTHDAGKKPLCLAVFGPPGSGKSFGVKQIAKAMGGKDARFLEFNVSQFDTYADLIGPFHQIRDAALGPEVPFVFWDEFDSKQYKWLQYLLAPMQDGVFQEGTSTHPIGKCIFIFAGGTSEEMADFGPPKPPAEPKAEHEKIVAEYHDFKLKKGPDFVSRISGSLDVLGPNEKKWKERRAQDRRVAARERDICFPIRRALFMRATLKLKPRERLDIDRGLLAAILGTHSYKNGARSLERLLLEMRARSTGRLMRSALPPPEVLNLFVDVSDFYGKLVRDQLHFDLEKVAAELHGSFLRDLAKDGRQPEPPFRKEYKDLEEEHKDENRAAARRIPLVLELAGLYVVRDPDGQGTARNVTNVLRHYLEMLAEAEHDLWVEHKRRCGWRLGQRDEQARTHPDLVPYNQLPPRTQQKDRDQVLSFPDVLLATGYRIAHEPEDPR